MEAGILNAWRVLFTHKSQRVELKFPSFLAHWTKLNELQWNIHIFPCWQSSLQMQKSWFFFFTRGNFSFRREYVQMQQFTFWMAEHLVMTSVACVVSHVNVLLHFQIIKLSWLGENFITVFHQTSTRSVSHLTAQSFIASSQQLKITNDWNNFSDNKERLSLTMWIRKGSLFTFFTVALAEALRLWWEKNMRDSRDVSRSVTLLGVSVYYVRFFLLSIAT